MHLPPSIGRRPHRIVHSLSASLSKWSTATSAGMLFVFLLLVYVPTATWDLRVNTDAAMAAMPAWSVAEHGTLDLSQHAEFLEGRAVAEQQVREIDGRILSGRNPGAILWGIPFYIAASPWTSADPLPMGPAAVAAAVASALAVAILHLVFRRLVSPIQALMAALVFGFGTTTWAVSADALWTHGPSQMWLAVSLLTLSSGLHAWTGMALAAALFTRPYAAFAAAAAGLYASFRHRSVRPAVVIGVTSALGLAALVAYSRLVFDQWSVLGGYYVFEDAYLANVTGTSGGQGLLERISFHVSRFGRSLFDPLQGLFVYSPFLILLVPGVHKGWAVAPSWVRTAALAGLAQYVAQVLVNGWFGGDFMFGYRYPLEGLTLWSPLLLLTWREHVVPDRGRHQLFLFAVAFTVLLMAYGAVLEPYKG